MSVLGLSGLFVAASCAQPDYSLSTIPVNEISPGAEQLLHYPTDGQQIAVNPPGFTWTAFPDAARYRLLVFKGGDAERPVFEIADQRSTVAVLPRALEPGSWEWLVVYEDTGGKAVGRSRRRSFSLEELVPQLVMPDVIALRDDLQGMRPRMFLVEERLRTIREAIQEKRIPLWSNFQDLVERGFEEPLYPEPEPFKNGEWTTPEWRRIYTPAKVGSSHMLRLALAYKLFGKKQYLDRAKQWLLHLSSWDPRGITSHDVPQRDGTEGNDEASMPLLERMAIAYDWLFDELTEAERDSVRSSITERGNQVLALLKKQDFLSKPFSNHEGRVLAFLGLAGLSFLGEIPEAEQWLDYVLRCYLTSYPVWGDDDGGWAQGLSYWSGYVLWLTEFADALRTVTPVDIYKRPFFRNTGYFPVYFHPPYAVRGGFGDGGDSAPTLGEKLLIHKFATAFEDPVLLWHSSQIDAAAPSSGWNEWLMEDIHGVLDSAPAALQPKAPTDLANTRWLKSIGWVALHSALGKAGEDVWLLFKSSRFGSFSHSHADQNSFQLNAFGEALLIDSGYYPWYGSPHHTLWTRQTRAHNAILINGRGQPPYSMGARGEIEYFKRSDPISVVRGEAAEAYNLPASESTVKLWKETFGTPYPSLEPKAETARRTVAFVAEGRPWVAVQDYVQTASPTRFQFLLHSLEKMALEESSGKVTVHSGRARLDVYLRSDQPLVWTQSDRFPVAPEERYEGAAEQFHLTAGTSSDSKTAKFLALLVPYRAGESPPEVKPVTSNGVNVGFQVGKSRVIAWWAEGEVGALGPNREEGRLLIESVEKGRQNLLVAE